MSTPAAVCDEGLNFFYSAFPQFLSIRAELACASPSLSIESRSFSLMTLLLPKPQVVESSSTCYWLNHIILLGRAELNTIIFN